jgi:hypothetical protein
MKNEIGNHIVYEHKYNFNINIFIFYKGNDTMFLNIILHACGQVKILRISFMDIDATSSKIEDHFDMLTQRHIHLMQIVNKLVKTVSFVLLMQLFISSVLLCIIGKCYITFLHYVTFKLPKFANRQKVI